jgi:hypothetical protein
VITGRTGQNKLVHFAPGDVSNGPVGPSRPGPGIGSYAEVLVAGAARHHLVGELLAVTSRPRHKTRIPVTAG